MNKIKDFQEGQHIETLLLVKAITKGVTSSGSPYLTLTLQDNSGSIEAKIWDVKPEVSKLVEIGKIYNFDFEVNSYRNNLQLKIVNLFPVIQEEVDINEFIVKTNVSKDELRNFVNDSIISIKNEVIRHIVREVLAFYENKFYDYPAASKNHHNIMGGLSLHTCSMIKIGNEISKLYPIINRDLLIAGIILHDLGKIEELGGNLISEYTTQGKLLGHISICAARLFEIGKNLGYERSEELLLLRHLVLSHHGQLEFGSPIRPQIVEAEVLNYIDNIDARLNSLENALGSINENEFTPRIFSLENRSFYKHNI